MSDQFICISCWKEFAARADDLKQHGGKVVCPFCGYVQPAPAKAPGAAEDPVPIVKLEGGEPTGELVAEVPWSSVQGDDDDIPISEDEERTDRVEIPASFIEAASGGGLMGFEEGASDQKTPMEVLQPEGGTGGATVEPSDGALVRELREAEADGGPIVWQLRTPSGLTFKFTDPEALLGWKKKISTYKQLDVSPDGERWVDFSLFVREYEELGDPVRAFVLSSRLDDDDLPPPAPVKSLEDLEGETEENASGVPEEKSAKGKGLNSPQFTFKVKEEKTGGWGKYFAFAVLGLGLGAGIVLAVLHFTGIFELPI
jgi:DNA-directed RNA polymerase subunit RPC12/RpoP